MIKFALAVLAVIVVGAGIFMFTQSQENVTKTAKPSVQPQQSMVDNTKAVPERQTTEEVKHETAPVAQAKTEKVKAAKTEEKAPLPTAESTADSSAGTDTSKGEDLDKIGEGLSLKDIEAMDVSEEEKERLHDDLVFYHSQHAKPFDNVSEDQILQMITEEDIQN